MARQPANPGALDPVPDQPLLCRTCLSAPALIELDKAPPALRPVREIMEKLDPKPEPQPLPAQGKRVEPSWRLARKRRR